MRSCHCIVRGRVQGVGFRYFTRNAALANGVSGWVRNLPDGEVEIRAEGSADEVQRFLDEVKKGPRSSRVSALEVQPRKSESFTHFEIRI